MGSHEATVGPSSLFSSAVALVGVSFPIQTDICHQCLSVFGMGLAHGLDH